RMQRCPSGPAGFLRSCHLGSSNRLITILDFDVPGRIGTGHGMPPWGLPLPARTSAPRRYRRPARSDEVEDLAPFGCCSSPDTGPALVQVSDIRCFSARTTGTPKGQASRPLAPASAAPAP